VEAVTAFETRLDIRTDAGLDSRLVFKIEVVFKNWDGPDADAWFDEET
jgi:hypothetical protein